MPGKKQFGPSQREIIKMHKKLRIKLTREGFLRKNIVAVLFFQNCAIHPYSSYISFPLNKIIQALTYFPFAFIYQLQIMF